MNNFQIYNHKKILNHKTSRYSKFLKYPMSKYWWIIKGWTPWNEMLNIYENVIEMKCPGCGFCCSIIVFVLVHVVFTVKCFKK